MGYLWIVKIACNLKMKRHLIENIFRRGRFYIATKDVENKTFTL